ncbi:hypothetical protein CK203_047969 [Vitis vinifera]|uniref:Uncharacterized protein n=1 Tax=Vitis vinifera TaxID=29760 RepID=A0A438GH84_VITVI|nr:hypothetical protein CK203_047969 [Vitis vinifera]
MRESKRARETASGESVSRAENRRKRKTSSFGWSQRPLSWKWAFHGRLASVHRGCEGRKMGKGLEGEGEKLLLSA